MGTKPLISVIIPVYNEQTAIVRCLDSLQAIEYSDDKFEVIVVDNNSTDATARIIKRYPVTYLCETRRGSYAARNSGVKIAQGDILAFTDADCVVNPNWLQEIEQSFSHAGLDAVLGSCGGINGNLWAEFAEHDYEKFVEIASDNSRYLRHLNTRNCAVRTRAFSHVGGFDARLHNSGDEEFGTRLHDAGYRITFVPAVRVNHINPTRLDVIMRQRRKQGYFEYQIVRECNEEYTARYFPRFHRWYYRWLFCHNSVLLVRINARIFGTLIHVAQQFSCVLLEGLAKLRLRKLYRLYSLALDLAFFHGKVIAVQEDTTRS